MLRRHYPGIQRKMQHLEEFLSNSSKPREDLKGHSLDTVYHGKCTCNLLEIPKAVYGAALVTLCSQ